jgi:hypothetical protein
MDEQDGSYVQSGGPFGPLDGYDSRREAAALGHGFEPERPPHDEALAARAKGWTTRAVLVAALVLALLNARALQTWAETLPPDWAGETARALADAWTARTDAAGLGRPRAAMHAAYAQKKALRWGDLR